MKKVDNLTREKLDELKLGKLRKLLQHIYKYSPYYQKLFTDININEDFINKINIKDLYKIPTMTKEKYVANYDDIVTDKNVNLESVINFDNRNDYVLDNQKLYLDKYHIVHTSGTEEKPFYVVYDKKAWEETIFGIIRIAL